MTLSPTPPIKTRKPYTKRASKKMLEEPTFVKKILKEELLGWNNKETIAYFFETIETVDNETKEFYVAVPDEGVRIYTEERPKIEIPLEEIKPAKRVSKKSKSAFA